jgi:hypothetical protein
MDENIAFCRWLNEQPISSVDYSKLKVLSKFQMQCTMFFLASPIFLQHSVHCVCYLKCVSEFTSHSHLDADSLFPSISRSSLIFNVTLFAATTSTSLDIIGTVRELQILARTENTDPFPALRRIMTSSARPS